MMETLKKHWPTAFGFLVAWWIFDPPRFLQALGYSKYFFLGLLGAGALLAQIAGLILTNLNEDIDLSLSPDPPHPEVQRLVERMSALGFQPAGPALHILGLSHPGLLCPLVHREFPIFASVFRIEAAPAKVGWDFMSILNTIITLWRILTKRNPHRGPLHNQKNIQKQIQAVYRARPTAR